MGGLDSSRARVHRNLHDGNFVLLKVNNTVKKALIDTGANNSCVSESFVKRLHNAVTKKGECRNLKKRWLGPFLIVQVSSDGLTYRLSTVRQERNREQESITTD